MLHKSNQCSSSLLYFGIDFLIDHLKVMITTLSAADRTKELIALNGHFKYFDPLDFKDLDVK